MQDKCCATLSVFLPFPNNPVEQFSGRRLHLGGGSPQPEGVAVPHLAVQNFHLRVTAVHAHPSPGPVRQMHIVNKSLFLTDFKSFVLSNFEI